MLTLPIYDPKLEKQPIWNGPPYFLESSKINQINWNLNHKRLVDCIDKCNTKIIGLSLATEEMDDSVSTPNGKLV